MKATIHGVQVEGTPEELAEFIKGATATKTVVAPVAKRGRPRTVDVVAPVKRTRKTRRGGSRFHMWTAQDDQFLRENYAPLGGKKCAKTLKRTVGAVKVRACLIGVKSGRKSPSKHKVFLKGSKPWTPEELGELKALRPQLENRATRSQTIRDFAQRHNRTAKGVTIRVNMNGYSLYRKQV